MIQVRTFAFPPFRYFLPLAAAAARPECLHQALCSCLHMKSHLCLRQSYRQSCSKTVLLKRRRIIACSKSPSKSKHCAIFLLHSFGPDAIFLVPCAILHVTYLMWIKTKNVNKASACAKGTVTSL